MVGSLFQTHLQYSTNKNLHCLTVVAGQLSTRVELLVIIVAPSLYPPPPPPPAGSCHALCSRNPTLSSTTSASAAPKKKRQMHFTAAELQAGIYQMNEASGRREVQIE